MTARLQTTTTSPAARYALVIESQTDLLSRLRRLQIDGSLFQDIEQHGDTLLQFYHDHPVQATALGNMHKAPLDYVGNLCANFTGLLMLFALRNQWNHTSIQQLLGAAISWISCNQPYLEAIYNNENNGLADPAYKKLRLVLPKALKKLDKQVWYKAHSSLSHSFLKQPSQQFRQLSTLDKVPALFVAAFYLSLLTTRNHRFPALPFAVALKRISTEANFSLHCIVEPVLEYPGLIAPGCLYKDRMAGSFLILELGHDVVLAKQFNPLTKEYSKAPQQLKVQELTKPLPSRNLLNFDQVDVIWDNDWLEASVELHGNSTASLIGHSFRVDQPPSSLLAIINYLNQPDVDVNELCSLIEKEPSFAAYLQSSASQTGREKIPITDVKHSVMMYGFGRSQYVLTQHALISRLNQRFFPLQESFFQFLKLWAQIAAMLSEGIPSLLAEEVSNWVYFSCAGLFTNADLKTKCHWQLNNQQPLSQGCLANGPQSGLIASHSLKLAESWEQEKKLVSALSGLATKANLPKQANRNQTELILLTSLLTAKQVYFVGAVENVGLLPQLFTELGLGEQDLARVWQLALERTHTFCPINSQLA